MDYLSITIDSNIPSGPWTLYFHSPAETKWDISTFTKVATMKTWHDWWSVVEALKGKTFADGMFFLMRDPIPPLWENAKNVRGGSYSFRIQKNDVESAFISSAIACMLDRAVTSSDNRIHGISISPKKNFNIIKVWNTDSTRFKNASDLECIADGLKLSDIIYTPFLEKKM